MSLPTPPSRPVRGRFVAGFGLIAFLFVVIAGPLTNPVASEELTGPLGRWLRPVHQALFLGHGYRFFAPDPGPSHLVLYRIYRDGTLIRDGRFPDATQNWPRVIYHRWFMLSECLFQEHAQTPDRESFAAIQADLTRQIERFSGAGQWANAQHVQRILERQTRMYEKTEIRIRRLVEAVGQHLLSRSDGDRIELFIQERTLPSPADIMLGRKLEDPQFLSEPIAIGVWPASEDLPTGRGVLDDGEAK